METTYPREIKFTYNEQGALVEASRLDVVVVTDENGAVTARYDLPARPVSDTETLLSDIYAATIAQLDVLNNRIAALGDDPEATIAALRVQVQTLTDMLTSYQASDAVAAAAKVSLVEPTLWQRIIAAVSG